MLLFSSHATKLTASVKVSKLSLTAYSKVREPKGGQSVKKANGLELGLEFLLYDILPMETMIQIAIWYLEIVFMAILSICLECISGKLLPTLSSA